MYQFQPTHKDFSGFDEARRIMWCHEVRAMVHHRLTCSALYADSRITAIHINHMALCDRSELTGYDATGAVVATDVLYNEEGCQHLEIASEFDHDFTNLAVPAGSDLECAAACEDGWIVNMAVVRKYNFYDDRRTTQRAVLLQHMADLINTGQATMFTSPFRSEDTPDAA